MYAHVDDVGEPQYGTINKLEFTKGLVAEHSSRVCAHVSVRSARRCAKAPMNMHVPREPFAPNCTPDAACGAALSVNLRASPTEAGL